MVNKVLSVKVSESQHAAYAAAAGKAGARSLSAWVADALDAQAARHKVEPARRRLRRRRPGNTDHLGGGR